MRLGVFISGADVFIRRILEKSGYEYRIWDGDYRSARGLMEWSDISWFEWCDGIFFRMVNMPKPCQIVCRLHSYEVYNEMLGVVEWGNVDKLVFVSEGIRDIFNKRVEYNGVVRSVVIPNGVDIENREYKERSHGKRIGYIGYVNYKKNPGLLLDVMAELSPYGYELHWAGIHQDARIEDYWNHIKEVNELKIIEHGWVDDVDKWIDDTRINYVISTSYLESFCYGIADGMVKGVKPLIHNFVGSDKIYPTGLIWNKFKRLEELLSPTSEYDSEGYRKWIEDRYNMDMVVDRIKGVLESC